MGNGTREGGTYGPGWADVEQSIQAFGKRWGGYWTVRIHPATRRGSHWRLSVVCSRRYGSRGSGGDGEDTVGELYPTSDGISMPALMHKLLYELDRKLESRAGRAERQMRF